MSTKFKPDIKFEDYYKPEEFIFVNPSILPEGVFDQQALDYLPADTGIEIECSLLPSYSKELFDAIPNLVENKSDPSELRFRIPTGMNGLKCLWDICILLNQHCQLSSSGIHIHVDLGKYYNILSKENFRKDAADFVLTELDTWKYKGTYNYRHPDLSHGYVRFQSIFKTMEIRICEMTFDYTKLIKRIVHCHYIRKALILHHKDYLIKEYEELIEKRYNDLNSVEEDGSVFDTLREQLDAVFRPMELI